MTTTGNETQHGNRARVMTRQVINNNSERAILLLDMTHEKLQTKIVHLKRKICKNLKSLMLPHFLKKYFDN